MPLKTSVFNVGDANFIAAVDGRSLVVLDAGRDIQAPLFERRLALGEQQSAFRRFLRDCGRDNRIDDVKIIISHQDADHFNLLPALFADLRDEGGINVSGIYIGGNRDSSRSNIDKTLQMASRTFGRELAVDFIGNRTKDGKISAQGFSYNGSRIIQHPGTSNHDVRFRFGNDRESEITLAVPKSFQRVASPWGRNCESLVAVLQSRGRKILLPGDATTDVLEGIKRRYGDSFFYDVNTIVTPHHSADTGFGRYIRGMSLRTKDEGQTLEWLKAATRKSNSRETPVVVISSERRSEVGEAPGTVLPSGATVSKRKVQGGMYLGDQMPHEIHPNLRPIEGFRTRDQVAPFSFDLAIEDNGAMSLHGNDYTSDVLPLLSRQEPQNLCYGRAQDLLSQIMHTKSGGTKTAEIARRMFQGSTSEDGFPEAIAVLRNTKGLAWLTGVPKRGRWRELGNKDDSGDEIYKESNDKIVRLLRKHRAGFKSTFQTKRALENIHKSTFGTPPPPFKLKDFKYEKEINLGRSEFRRERKEELLEQMNDAQNVSPSIRFSHNASPSVRFSRNDEPSFSEKYGVPCTVYGPQGHPPTHREVDELFEERLRKLHECRRVLKNQGKIGAF